MSDFTIYALLGVLPEALIYTIFLVLMTKGKPQALNVLLMVTCLFALMVFNQQVVCALFGFFPSLIVAFFGIWLIYEIYSQDGPLHFRSMIVVAFILGLHMSFDILAGLYFGINNLAKVYATDLLTYYVSYALPERILLGITAILIALFRNDLHKLYEKLVGNWRKN